MAYLVNFILESRLTVRPKMDLTHRPHTTMIRFEEPNYRIMGSSHVGRVLQTKRTCNYFPEY